MSEPIGPFLEKPAVYRAGYLGTVRVGFRGRGEHVLAHILTAHLGLPTECRPIKRRHPLPILVRHLKVHDGIHARFLHSGFRVMPLSARWPSDYEADAFLHDFGHSYIQASITSISYRLGIPMTCAVSWNWSRVNSRAATHTLFSPG